MLYEAAWLKLRFTGTVAINGIITPPPLKKISTESWGRGGGINIYQISADSEVQISKSLSPITVVEGLLLAPAFKSSDFSKNDVFRCKNVQKSPRFARKVKILTINICIFKNFKSWTFFPRLRRNLGTFFFYRRELIATVWYSVVVSFDYKD